MGFFAFIFVFLLGGVVALVGAAFAIYYFLIIYEHKTDAQRAKLAKEFSPEESQRATQLLIPELKTKVRFSFSPAPWPKEAAKRMQHTTIVLKANMFFHFLDEKRDACSIARLDGCAVEVLRQGGKAKFNKKNYLKLVSPAGSLFPDAAASTGGSLGKNAGDTCYVKFNNGKDLELWYYALKSATSLTITKEQKEVELMQLQQRYFAHLTAVANNSAEVNADWANALLGRVFWGVHSHPVFIKLITEKLQKKMSKLKKPKFVESISVSDVGFGPNLPLLSNIKILSVSPQGSLAFDGDIYYHGGFNLMIDIMLRIDLPIGGVSVEVPIRASVVVKAFAGRGHIQVAPPPAKRAWIGFYGEPRVDLDVKIEVGKDLKLVNIPSIANIVINKIKQQLIKKLVLPAMDDWPLPHIPSPKTIEQEAQTIAAGVELSSSTPSPALSRAQQAERSVSLPSSSSSSTLSSSSSSSSGSVATKRHSVSAVPSHARPAQPITVKTRTSPRDRVPSREMSEQQQTPTPPLPARAQSPGLAHILEAGSQPYRPLSGVSSTPPAVREGASALAGLQLPSAPPGGQWNSTDEWYKNSLMALRDRDDDSDDTDGSDRESSAAGERRGSEAEAKAKARALEQAERERKEREEKEREEKERKLKEEKERNERARQEKEREEREQRDREEKERLDRAREREESERKKREQAEREEREAKQRKDKAEADASSERPSSSALKDNEDISREIEQFTAIGNSDQGDEDDRKQRREEEEAEEERRRQREEREREERERERREKERAEQERREKEERQEKERKNIQVKKQEVFTDPLSSSLNSPLIEEIFGSDEPVVPKRQSTFDPDRSSSLLDELGAPQRRRSGSLNATSLPPVSPVSASSVASRTPPALPPRAHEQHHATDSTKPGTPKYRTTSQMFEDNFDFSFPSAVPAATMPLSSPAAPSHHPSASSSSLSSSGSKATFLGLNTPTGGSATPPSPSPSTSPSSTSSADSLFSFSSSSSSSLSSSSSAVPSSSSATTAKSGKKGLFNLDMDELFNKVEKQHHLVEKFKAAKTRAQNAIHDWNAPGGHGNQDL